MNVGNRYGSTPIKKRRGRPKKYETPGRMSDGSQGGPSQFHGHRTHLPTGAHGSQSHQEDAAGDVSILGVSVTGVIEGSFDDGYILSVQIGNSETPLRGVIFKPGHYLPVTAELDVAPHVQMIKRKEVPFPSTSSAPMHRAGRRGRARDSYPLSLPIPSNQLVAYKGKEVSIVPAQLPPPTGWRGTVVPVILKPVGSPNGVLPSFEAPPITSRPAHLATSKAKQVELTSPRDGMPVSSQPNNGSMAMEGADKVASSIGRSPESANPVKSSGLTHEQIRDLGQPLLIQPLQAIRSGTPDQSLSMQPPVKGKMTELLLSYLCVDKETNAIFCYFHKSMQGNVLEKHAAEAWPLEQKNVVK
ncbi:METABOLIC NETWORK MODULATOR 1-like protein [Drosera capensis]